MTPNEKPTESQVSPAPTSGDVLLLDDDPDLLDSISMLFEATSQRRVWAARSVQEMMALEEKVLGCSLAVLDINLGEGRPNGLDALRWLRQRLFGGRVVFLTGYSVGAPLLETVQKMGDVQVIIKPAGIEQLLTL